ncbi:MAG TPA: LytTR family DNA-binding domain-containing protein [Chitinophagaceae bacterium]|nr:LytTR family DNA-binding domain-containing protein [Chitinophagaceae bacterium]
MKIDFVFVRTGDIYTQVRFDDIIYVKTEGDCCVLVTTVGSQRYINSIRVIQRYLPPARFVRTHRSYIINVERLVAFDREWLEIQGTYKLEKLPLGYRYRNDLRRRVPMLIQKSGSFSRVKRKAVYQLEDEEFEIEMKTE